MTLVEALLSAIATLSAVIVFLFLKLLAVVKEKNDLQEARLSDQKLATDALLRVNDKTHEALSQCAEVMEYIRHQPAQPYQANPTGMRSPK